MKTFEITFGTGNEAVTLIDDATDVVALLGTLKIAGWEVEEITSIKNR